MKPSAVVAMVHTHWPEHLESRQKAILLDKWQRGEQYDLRDDSDFEFPNDTEWDRYSGSVYTPPDREDEHVDLESRASTPWAGLVVTSLVQTAHVDGIRKAGSTDTLPYWETWQANHWDAKQSSIHRAAAALSCAYGIALPGKNPLTGESMTKLLARSPKRMTAFYAEDDDEWPYMAIDATKRYIQPEYTRARIFDGWQVEVYDEQVVHRLTCKGNGRDIKDWTYIDYETHGLPVPPVARGANRVDLDGRTTGEIEPVLPLLRRIDQDTFDRLIVQRFGAWKVRYIAGMAKPSKQMEANMQALQLKITDLLVSGDKDTKFGVLEGTDPTIFSGVTDADLRMLSAVTQTPPHHLLGLSSNLQAESLAAAESGLQRKSADFKRNMGEFHESMARLDAMYRGDLATASAFDLQVRWRDTESRSLVQAADALGKLAVQLKIPVEMLWERIPDWTDSDTDRAKELIETGTVEQLLADLAQQSEIELANATQSPDDQNLDQKAANVDGNDQ